MLAESSIVVTGRNEVLAKVMFLHVCVILFTGGGVPDQVPPWDQTPPPDQGGTPLGPDPPKPGRNPPPRQQTPEYGQRSARTHPTGMHSCYEVKSKHGIKGSLAYLICETKSVLKYDVLILITCSNKSSKLVTFPYIHRVDAFCLTAFAESSGNHAMKT